MRDNSQKNSSKMEGFKEKTSQTSTDNSETTLEKIKEEVGAEIATTHCVERENAEKGADKEAPTPSEKESERSREVLSESNEEIKNAGSQTCQAIKEEKIEEPTARKPSEETLKSCQNTDKDDGKERSKSSKEVPTQFKNSTCKENERKRPSSSMSEKSQEDTAPDEDVEKEMCHKRPRVTFKQEAPCEEPQHEEESGKPSHETAKGKGM